MESSGPCAYGTGADCAGKDKTLINLLMSQSVKKAGTYYYLYPTGAWGRRALWQGMDRTGFKFMDHIPKELIKRTRDDEMRVELINDSSIQIIGTDRLELVGPNPIGCVFSEYSLQNPKAWEYIRPILLENKGFAVFNFCVTPDTLCWTDEGPRLMWMFCKNEPGFRDLDMNIFGLGGMHYATQFYEADETDVIKFYTKEGFTISCTPNHPLWTGNEWREAKDWSVGDLIPILRSEYDWDGEVPRLTIGDRKFVLDEDECYLLGILLMRGSFKPDGRITIWSRSIGPLEDFLNGFGFRRKTGMLYELKDVARVQFYEWLGVDIWERKPERSFPIRMLGLPKSHLAKFLRGISDTTGHYSGERIDIRIYSNDIRYMFMRLLLGYGVVGTQLFMGAFGQTVRIDGYDAKKFCDNIGYLNPDFTKACKRANNFMYDDYCNDFIPIPTKELRDELYPYHFKGSSRLRRSTLITFKQEYGISHPFIDHNIENKFKYLTICARDIGRSKVCDFVIPETHSFVSNGFVSHNTPRGHNHGFEIYNMALDNPDWFCELLTVDDTGAISKEDIESERRAGMSEELIQQEFYCFPPGSMVWTSQGQIPIDDVRLGDVVLTHAGRWRTVKDVLQRDYDGDVIEIHTAGNSRVPLCCTPEHPIRICDPSTQTYSWVMAKDVLVGDYAVLPRLKEDSAAVVSDDMIELIGWFIAEGSVSKNHVQFTLNKNETDVANRIMDIGGKFGKSSLCEAPTAMNVCINSCKLADFLVNSCGSGAKNKRIPWHIIVGHEQKMLDVLLDGDGCRGDYSGCEAVYTTVSYSLALDVQMLAHICGKVASITLKDKEKQNNVICGREVEVSDSYAVRISAPKKLSASWREIRPQKHGVAVKIREIARKPYSGKVYNLSVAFDESYVVNGRVVHNCSFEGGLEGAYYAKVLADARREGRITNVPIEKLPVYTAWDLGRSDATAIWFWQRVGQEIHFIDYYENSGEELEHYAKILQAKGYLYGEHYAPHDARAKRLSAPSIEDRAYELGIRFVVLPPEKDVNIGIENVRSMFNRFWFDASRCKDGINALASYRKEYDERHQCFKQRPLHDWTADAADSLRYAARAIRDYQTGSYMSQEEADRMYESYSLPVRI